MDLDLRTYDRSRFRSFDWETVGFNWGAGSCCFGFLVLALDLKGVLVWMFIDSTRLGAREECTFAFLETGILADSCVLVLADGEFLGCLLRS